MAAKYMGAKMLKKQLEKEKAAKENREARKKGSTFGNKGEYLDRKKKHFEITASSMQIEGDFDIIKDDDDNDAPEYQKAYDALRKNEYFLLTYDDDLTKDMDNQESTDEEEDEIHAMLHRANTETLTLFKGAASSSGLKSEQSVSRLDESQSMLDEDATHRPLLEENEVEVSALSKKQIEFERDVKRLKSRIEGNLNTY